MQCEQVQRELIGYQHGSLSPQERAAVEEHLSRCEACKEEAVAMNQIGELLSRGLKGWVEQGVCPADVAQRIEQSLRDSRKRVWWQRWPALMGAAAAAVAVFVVVLATQPQVAHQMASVPLLGALAAQLIDPDIEFHVDPQQPVTAALVRPVRTVDLEERVEADGVTLTVDAISTGRTLMRVEYTLEGSDLMLPSDRSLLAPKLTTAANTVDFRGLTADRKGDAIHFTAYFGAVPEGERLTLTVPVLSAENGEQKGPWTVSFTN